MHRGTRAKLPLALLAVAAVLTVAAAQRYGDEPAGGTAVSTGVFTEEQAARGGELFARRCAGCHGAQLQGGMGPRLAPLDGSWQGLALAELYRFVSTNMPMDAPGSLEPQQYADALAFVLASNGYAAGEAELPADPEALQAIVIDAPPGR